MPNNVESINDCSSYEEYSSQFLGKSLNWAVQNHIYGKVQCIAKNGNAIAYNPNLTDALNVSVEKGKIVSAVLQEGDAP